MNCPRCDIELTKANINKWGLTCNAHSCSQCDGYWIGAKELEDIEMSGVQRLVELRRIPSKQEQYEALSCPQCEGDVDMDKVENQRDKKVIMDVCPKCENIWLDGGEKEAIRQEGFGSLLMDTFRWLRGK